MILSTGNGETVLNTKGRHKIVLRSVQVEKNKALVSRALPKSNIRGGLPGGGSVG